MLTNDKSFPMLMLNVTCKSVTPAQTAKHLPDRWSHLPPRAQEEHRGAGQQHHATSTLVLRIDRLFSAINSNT